MFTCSGPSRWQQLRSAMTKVPPSMNQCFQTSQLVSCLLEMTRTGCNYNVPPFSHNLWSHCSLVLWQKWRSRNWFFLDRIWAYFPAWEVQVSETPSMRCKWDIHDMLPFLIDRMSHAVKNCIYTATEWIMPKHMGPNPRKKSANRTVTSSRWHLNKKAVTSSWRTKTFPWNMHSGWRCVKDVCPYSAKSVCSSASYQNIKNMSNILWWLEW